jgi:hypothetical protein
LSAQCPASEKWPSDLNRDMSLHDFRVCGAVD